MKMGCISTLPLLQPESNLQALDLPVAPLTGFPAVNEALPEGFFHVATLRTDPDLFLQHHQILV